MRKKELLRTAGETADLLGVKESTLRKYALALEKEGYTFAKNSRGHRSFLSDDVTILQRFVSAKEANDMTVEDAAKAVISVHREDDVRAPDTASVSHRSGKPSMTKTDMLAFMKKQEAFIEKQTAFNEKLLETLYQLHQDQEQKQGAILERLTAWEEARAEQDRKELAAATEKRSIITRIKQLFTK